MGTLSHFNGVAKVGGGKSKGAVSSDYRSMKWRRNARPTPNVLTFPLTATFTGFYGNIRRIMNCNTKAFGGDRRNEFPIQYKHSIVHSSSRII